jgi:hypothetical protein
MVSLGDNLLENMSLLAKPSAGSSHLELLLIEKSRLEKLLDESRLKIDALSLGAKGDVPANTSNYREAIEAEQKNSNEWNCIFQSILTYSPRTHKETSAAIIALLDFIKAGHDQARINTEIRRLASALEHCM